MIAVHLKQPVIVDLTLPFRAFIDDNFSTTEADSTRQAIQEIHDTRSKLTVLFERVRARDANLDGLFLSTLRYHQLLKLVESRFPFGRFEKPGAFAIFNRAKTPAVMVPFIWNDSYRSQKSSCDYSLAFEQAAIMFNLGAISSHCALSQDRKSDDGLKAAIPLFTRAAMFFNELQNRPLVADALETFDLCELDFLLICHGSLALLCNLMLAQAQACVYEGAQRKKTNTHTLAKLAEATSTLFAQAHLATQRDPTLLEWLVKSGYSWHLHVLQQHFCYRAAAHLAEAKALLEEDKYGMEITRLRAAISALNEAMRVEDSTLVSQMRETREALREQAVSELARAEKDNDTVYHYSIPTLADLPIIEGRVMVKIPAFDSLAMPIVADMFEGLVPAVITDTNIALMARLGEWSTQTTKLCEEKTQQTKETLSRLRLPAALDSIQTNTGVPPSLLQSIQSVRQRGGMPHLQTLREQLKSSSQQAIQMSIEIRTMLQEERLEEGKYRSRFTNRWNRVSSDEITVSFYSDLTQVEKYLNDAEPTNEKIYREMDSMSDQLQMLELSDQQLSIRVAGSTSTTTSQTGPSALLQEPVYLELKDTLARLNGLLEARQAAIDTLVPRISKHSFVTALVSQARDKSSDQTYASEFATTFEPIDVQLSQNRDAQAPLLDKLAALMTLFSAIQQRDASAQQRQTVLQGLNDALLAYDRLLNDLNCGVSFHSNLITTYLDQIRPTVSDFCFARKEEARSLLESITLSMSKLSVANGPNGAGTAAPVGNYGQQQSQPYGSVPMQQSQPYGSVPMQQSQPSAPNGFMSQQPSPYSYGYSNYNPNARK